MHQQHWATSNGTLNTALRRCTVFSQLNVGLNDVDQVLGKMPPQRQLLQEDIDIVLWVIPRSNGLPVSGAAEPACVSAHPGRMEGAIG